MAKNTMADAPGNSNKAKELANTVAAPAETAETMAPVAVKRRPNPVKTAANRLIDGATQGGKLNLTETILKPAVNNVIMQTVKTVAGSLVNVFEIALFGQTGPGSKMFGSEYDYNAQYRTAAGSRVTIIRNDSAQNYSTVKPTNAGYSAQARAQHQFDEIFFPDPGGMAKAKDTLNKILDLKEAYPVVRVSDFYQACNLSWNFQDTEWGWTDLMGAAPRSVFGGAVIDMPKPEYLGH